MVTGLDQSSLVSLLQDGFSRFPQEVTAHLDQIVTAGLQEPVAGTVLPIVLAGLVQNKAVELGGRADQRLSSAAEALDNEDPKQQMVASCLRGLLKVFPDGEQWEQAIIQTANGDPDSLVSLLETYQRDPDRREELEEAIGKVFTGEFEELEGVDGRDSEVDIIEGLQDLFDTDSKDDALAMFLDVRELMLSHEVHEILETSAEIEISITELSDELDRTRRDIETKLNDILEANLKSEGFTRLSPYYFRRRDPVPPSTGWRAGFDLAAVQDGQALEREYETREGRRQVYRDLCEEIEDANDLVVLGRPGSGKSTICKTVACEWYDQQRGTVYYRESDTGQEFTETGVLEERIRDGEGHVLVVVEDAARESSNRIFEVMLEYRSDPNVSFLLDSRVEEWDEADQEFTNPRILNLKDEIVQYQVPDFDENECARAITKFERSTGHTVVESATELLDQIETDIGAGEMYLLGYRLSSYGVSPVNDPSSQEATGLRSEVRQAYNRLSNRRDELALQTGVLINILNAAEIGVSPDLLHSLADETSESGQIETLLQQFLGFIVFEGGTKYRANHPFWSVQFLEYALDRNERRTRHLFEECVNAVFELIDDDEKRRRVRQWCRDDTGFVDEIDHDRAGAADSLVRDLFEIGQRHPGLASLYGATDNSNITLPDACSREVQLNATKWRGNMYLDAGNPDIAESEFELLLEEIQNDTVLSEAERNILLGQAYLDFTEVSRERGDLDGARERGERAIELFDALDNKPWKADAFAELGVIARRSGDLERADEYYEQSINLCRDVGYRYGVAKALNNRGMVEKDRGNLERAQEDIERAIEVKREEGDRRASVAISINTLGEILYQKGELDKAEQRLEQSLRIKRELGYQSGCAWSLYYLGLVELERENYDGSRSYLVESLEIRRDIDAELGVGRCLNALGEVYYHFGEYDRAQAYHEWALEHFREVGDEIGKARFKYYVGMIQYQRRFFDDAIQHLQEAIERFDEIGNKRDIARSYRGLGKVAKELGSYKQARDYFEEAIHEFEALSSHRSVAEVIDEIAETCEAADDHTSAREWRRKRRELDETSK